VSDGSVAADHRDAVEAIALGLERLAVTVRSLIPERDPVDGKDWLDPLRPRPAELDDSLFFPRRIGGV